MKRFWQILTPLVLLSLGIWIWPYQALAATAGPNNCGTGADDATVGTITWTNPSNACASDNVYATAAISTNAATTHYLKGTNFGFSIPAGAAINGITVTIERKKSGALPTAIDSAVRIVKSSGAIGTQNKASGTSWTTADVVASYGSVADLWGETWTATDINNSNFGVVMSAVADPMGGSTTLSVDNYTITITYTVSVTNHAQVTLTQGITTQSKGITIIN